MLIPEKRIRAQGALLIVVAALALSGCVSSQKALDSADAAPADPAAEKLAANTPGTVKGNYRDPAVVTNASGAQQVTAAQNSPQSMPASAAAMQPANIGSMVMQPARINASAMSIFSARPAMPQNNGTSTIVQPADATAYAPASGVNATRSSVFSAPSQPALPPQPGEVPLPQQSSQNTSTKPAPSVETAMATGSITAGSMNALYAAPKQNLLGSLSGLLQKASLPGMTRVAPNGLHLQNGDVEVSCFKPNLLHVMKTIEDHFGKPVIVTSGYRDPEHNRLIGGAEESMHKTCDAADIQIAGVSKWDIAAYVRSLPDRGGVGTYCDTESVHVDTGKSRDWNWGCGAGQRRTLRGPAI